VAWGDPGSARLAHDVDEPAVFALCVVSLDRVEPVAHGLRGRYRRVGYLYDAGRVPRNQRQRRLTLAFADDKVMRPAGRTVGDARSDPIQQRNSGVRDR